MRVQIPTSVVKNALYCPSLAHRVQQLTSTACTPLRNVPAARRAPENERSGVDASLGVVELSDPDSGST